MTTLTGIVRYVQRVPDGQRGPWGSLFLVGIEGDSVTYRRTSCPEFGQAEYSEGRRVTVVIDDHGHVSDVWRVTHRAGCLMGKDSAHNWTGGDAETTRMGTLFDVSGLVFCPVCREARPVYDLSVSELHGVYANVARAHVGHVSFGSGVQTQARPMTDRMAQWALISYGLSMAGKPKRLNPETSHSPASAEHLAPGDMWVTVTVGPHDPDANGEQRIVTAQQLSRLPLDPRL